jgi:hypothetical protein
MQVSGPLFSHKYSTGTEMQQKGLAVTTPNGSVRRRQKWQQYASRSSKLQWAQGLQLSHAFNIVESVRVRVNSSAVVRCA